MESVIAAAAVPPHQAARLDADLTPVGAERAGNADGTIPEWTGGLPKTAAIDPVVGYIDPFAQDSILFTITAENANTSPLMALSASGRYSSTTISAPGKAATLDVAWIVRTKDGKTQTGRTSVVEKVPDNNGSYDALAAAHSRAVARLS